MLTFKNTASLTTAAVVATYLARFPTPWIIASGLAALITLSKLPTKEQTVILYHRARAVSGGALDYSKIKSKQFWAAIRPDNSEQNIYSGAAVGSAAGLLIGKLAALNEKTNLAVTVGCALVGSVGGHYLPNREIKRIAQKYGLVAEEKRSALRAVVSAVTPTPSDAAPEATTGSRWKLW